MFIIFDQPLLSPSLAAAGLVILLGSIVLAYRADEQLRRFRKIPENAGKTMNIGLWLKSRHPNYLGEMLTWWGLFILALSSGWQYWWTGMGALFITLMFVFISIPLMESYSLGRRTDYRDYRKKVPFLLPLKFKSD
jgi:steroid 5-alpha reductase family enzyme